MPLILIGMYALYVVLGFIKTFKDLCALYSPHSSPQISHLASCYVYSGVLKSPAIGFVLGDVFNSISMLFMKLDAPEFGAYMFSVVIFS